MSDSLVDHVPAVASDSAGVIWVVWEGGHFYDGYDNDIFYGRCDPSGAEEWDPGTRQLVVGEPYPNPSRGMVWFPVTVGSATDVALSAYDLAGRLVWTAGRPAGCAPGTTSFSWDGRDLSGAPTVSGVYVCRIRAGEVSLSRAVTISR
jgi:hypothetical protein